MKNASFAAIMMAMSFTASAELIENGDFSKGMSCWDLAVPAVYGPKPDAAIDDGALNLTRLHSAGGGYLSLNQAVKVTKGVKYRLSFEVRGSPAGGEYLLAIQDPGKGAHASKWLTTDVSWKREEIDFTGAFDTDSKWFKSWIRGMRKAELQGGETVKADMRDVRNPDGDEPARTWVTFSIGKLSGEFSIRNISIVDVP